MIRLLLVIFIASFEIANAGSELGNGGDVIVCPDGSVKFFDWDEAESRYGFNVVPPSGATLEEKVKSLLDRLPAHSPIRREIYWEEAREFSRNLKFIPAGKRLQDVPDADSAFIPAGCELRQLVVQSKPIIEGDKWFSIDKDYWDRLSIDHQAAVVVHEVLLKESTAINGHKNSRLIRYLNGRILSDTLSHLDRNEWNKLLTQLKFRYTEQFDFLGRVSYSNQDGTTYYMPHAMAGRSLRRNGIEMQFRKISKPPLEAVASTSTIPYEMFASETRTRSGSNSLGCSNVLPSPSLENENDYCRLYLKTPLLGLDSRITSFTGWTTTPDGILSALDAYMVVDRSFLDERVSFFRGKYPDCKLSTARFETDGQKIKLVSAAFETNYNHSTLENAGGYCTGNEGDNGAWKTAQGAQIGEIFFAPDDSKKIIGYSHQNFSRFRSREEFCKQSDWQVAKVQGIEVRKICDALKIDYAGSSFFIQKLDLHPNGFLKRAELKSWSDTKLKFVDGTERVVKAGARCEFAENELAIACKNP